ncbi:beta-lactamase/transpeptidase-like protein [Aspergillus californicus]
MWKIIAPCLAIAAHAAGEICRLPGPAFPVPIRALGSHALKKASSDFVQSVKNIMQPPHDPQASFIDPDLVSFAVQVYSAGDNKPLFKYYHTATNDRNNTFGVNKIDGDTVFRTGSISKLYAVLLILIQTGDASLHEPVTNYIPELREAIQEPGADDEIDAVQWEEVTIGELASQMSGFERSYGLGDRSSDLVLMDSLGFPHLEESDIPQCGLTPSCNRSQFFAGAMQRHPVFPTASSPAYSNDAYQLLGYVLEAMTSKPFRESLEKRLVERLRLTRTSYTAPESDQMIIPNPVNTSLWDLDLLELTPAGGIYASSKDMSALGRAILNHDLLSPALTRRWLKPAAYASEPTSAVGSPWEIYMLTEPRMIPLYTKAGDIGTYSGMMGLSPEHDVGFTIFAAGQSTTRTVAMLGDLVSTIMISGIENAAREEAINLFAGTYASTSGDASFTITTDYGPGLRVTKWTNNGMDMLKAIESLLSWVTDPIDLRLYPTGLKSKGKMSFRSTVLGSPIRSPNGPITRVCHAWQLVDYLVYGSVGVDEFVFEIGEDGSAVSVSPRALRVSLPRVSN